MKNKNDSSTDKLIESLDGIFDSFVKSIIQRYSSKRNYRWKTYEYKRFRSIRKYKVVEDKYPRFERKEYMPLYSLPIGYVITENTTKAMVKDHELYYKSINLIERKLLELKNKGAINLVNEMEAKGNSFKTNLYEQAFILSNGDSFELGGYIIELFDDLFREVANEYKIGILLDIEKETIEKMGLDL